MHCSWKKHPLDTWILLTIFYMYVLYKANCLWLLPSCGVSLTMLLHAFDLMQVVMNFEGSHFNPSPHSQYDLPYSICVEDGIGLFTSRK